MFSGPGSYTLPGIGSDVQTSSALGTAAFLPNGQIGRMPFDIKEQRRGIPGPLSYSHNNDFRMTTYEPKSMRRLPSASLRSTSNRESFLDFVSSAPGPGLYNVASGYDITTVMRSAQFSRSSGSQRPPTADSKVPGPGAYYNDPLVFAKEKTNSKRPNTTSTSKLKTFTGRRYNRLGGEDIFSKLPLEEFLAVGDFRNDPHTFGPGQRFKDTYFGRLDMVGKIPGPGAYTPNVSYQEQNRCSSPFRSKSPRIQSPLKHPSLRPPGPLYYNPHMSGLKTSFYFNRDNSWVWKFQNHEILYTINIMYSIYYYFRFSLVNSKRLCQDIRHNGFYTYIFPTRNQI